jgi:sialidase-1
MEHVVIYRKFDSYATFPHVARLASGELAVVFREAGHESAAAARQGQPMHQGPGARIALLRSPDGGVSWPGTPTAVWDGGEFVVADPAVTQQSEGTLLIRAALWRMVPKEERDRLGARVMRHYAHLGLIGATWGNAILRSFDGGGTWEEKPILVRVPPIEGAVSRDPIIELPDGTLALSVYSGSPYRPDSAYLVRSWDGGATWGDPSTVASGTKAVSYRQGVSYNETSVHFLESGLGIALLRVDRAPDVLGDNSYTCRGGEGSLAVSWSEDWGLSWTPPMPTPLAGQPGHLLPLRSGRLLCTYGYRSSPYGVRACLSEDAGRIWAVEREAILRDDGASWDVGYPSSVQLPDDRIFTVYYFHGPDGVRYIAGTLWEEQDALGVSRTGR